MHISELACVYKYVYMFVLSSYFLILRIECMNKKIIIFTVLSAISGHGECSEQTDETPNSVDILQQSINNMMQNTASWLDNIAAIDKPTGKASAKGYVQLGWLPRTSDIMDIETRFKVRLSLPSWNNRFALVLDNDDEDELKLDYEADSIDQDHSTDDVNLAVQYIKQFNDTLRIKNRLGISRNQLYARSEIRRNWEFSRYQLQISPRLDYYHSDGWAPGVKLGLTYPLAESLLSFSASWQEVQKELDARKKIGFHHIKNLKDTQLLVTGAQYNHDKYGDESYLASVRYRNLFYKKWLYFEVEPFLEFKQVKQYRREAGIALRLIGYYGR